jgi:hypothetical protein
MHTKTPTAHIKKYGSSCNQRYCLCSELEDTSFLSGHFRAEIEVARRRKKSARVAAHSLSGALPMSTKV